MQRPKDPWAHRGNLAWIEAQLRRRGLDPAHPTIEALSVHDQLHSGGLEASRAFLRWVEPGAGERVLDLGAGLGGRARLLARDHGCSVTALEPSAPLDEVGMELTRRLGLVDRVVHVRGDATRLHGAGAFDLAILQHVAMHVEDKAALYRACAGCLAPRGRLAWHDWLAGPGGPPRVPVPWTRDGEGSFLEDEAALRRTLRSVGFRAVTVLEISRETIAWVEASLSALGAALGRPPPVEPALLERRLELERIHIASGNLLRNVQERRLVPFFGEAIAWSPEHRAIEK